MLLLGLLAFGAAWARTSDRNQPMNIESGHQSGTFQSDSVSLLTGGVEITQGTLHITSATAEITMHDDEIARAVFKGNPVVLNQQMDDGTPMTARAGNVDYNLHNEVVVFTGNVELQQPRGSMSGERVVYNLKTGAIESGGEGNGRVKMRIMPKHPASPPAAATPATGTAPESTPGAGATPPAAPTSTPTTP